MQQSPDHAPIPNKPLPVLGAYEDFEGSREHLITLTRTGQLLQVGDQLPPVAGIELGNGPIVLHAVNEFGTPMCDACTSELERFHQEHPEIPIYSLTRQAPEKMGLEDGQPITHAQLQIDDETAINLGIALQPGEGADEDFWPTALHRTIAVVDAQGTITHIQQPDDQDQMLDFESAYQAVLDASAAPN